VQRTPDSRLSLHLDVIGPAWLRWVLGKKCKMDNSVTITLRNVETSDISILFEQQLDL
jgi:hypothetical protein